MLNVYEPLITKSDAKAVYKSLLKGWVSSSGPNVKKFENEFSKKIKKKYGIFVSNGSAALDISIKSLNLPKKSEIIIPNFTIISNYLCIIRNNFIPIPIDCSLNDWNINLELVLKKITRRTKAIIATHIYGFPIDMIKLKKICKKKKIIIIEDAAEQIGQKIFNKPVGSFGNLSTFSFYANKTITTGEGGMICTNDYKIYKKCLELRNLCFGYKNRFNHHDLGWNYRATNMQASLGLNQLKRLNKIVKRKKEIGKAYYNIFKKNSNFYIQPPKYKNFENIYWVVGIIIKKKVNILKIISKAKKLGIETREFFWPIHKQKIYKFKKKKDDKNFKNSIYLSRHGLYLPNSLNITKKKILNVYKIISSIV